MTIRHHPADATLVAYASGGLTEGLALAVAVHATLCPTCRAAIADLEAVGGVLLDELAPEALAPGAMDAVMGRLGTVERPVPQAAAEARTGLDFDAPLPLRPYLGGSASGGWRRLFPGIRQIEVLPRTPAGGNARLLRVAPGTALARHAHTGREMTVILSGSYADEVGRFAAGDFAEMDDELEHQPIADTASDCICLIATERPLRFSSLVGKLVQPFIRM